LITPIKTRRVRSSTRGRPLSENFALDRIVAEPGSVGDITDWPGVNAVFKRVSGDESFLKRGDDGRIGILQLRTPDQAGRPRACAAHRA
jgi:hypothetical protein